MSWTRMALLPFAAALLLAVANGVNAEANPPLDRSPVLRDDPAALQRGARTFVHYCLTCHPASLVRYNRLADLGFTERQIREELLPEGQRIGDPMTVAMRRSDAKRWFGVTPPDLSLEVRARTSTSEPGRDWVYTYLRGFYRDTTRPSGWNNVVFPNVAMHHALYGLQGTQTLGPDRRLTLAHPGSLNPAQYDALVADLVAFLEYASEPAAPIRRHVGLVVMGVMAVLVFFAFALKPPPRRPRRAVRPPE